VMKAVRRATRLCESPSPAHGEDMFQVSCCHTRTSIWVPCFLCLKLCQLMYLLYQLLHVTTIIIFPSPQRMFLFQYFHSLSMLRRYKETKNFMCDVQSDLRLKLSALHKDMYERKHRTNARERRIRIKNHAASFVETAII